MSDPIGKIMTAYAQDLEGLTEKECAEAGFSKRQFAVLTRALGKGAEGKLLEEEQETLAKIGFAKEAKCWHGFRLFWRRGLMNVGDEAYLIGWLLHLKRLSTLIPAPA